MTFIEMIVSMTLLAMILLATLSAMFAVSKGSAVHRTLADSQVWVAAAADEVRGSVVEYVPCAGPADYLVGHVPLQAAEPQIDVDVAIDSVQYWDGSGWTSTCPDDQALQLVTFSATAGETTSTVAVVKRAPVQPSRLVYVADGSSADPNAPVDEGGSGQAISIVPTPGINGGAPPTTTTAPTTTPGPTTTTPGPTTTVPGAPTTTPETTTPPTTAPPSGGPSCSVTGVATNQYWMDQVYVTVQNQTSQNYNWNQWSVRLTYSGSGSEPNGHFTSSWSGSTLTLRPAHGWVHLQANSTRNLQVNEPGGSMIGVSPASIGCVVGS